MKKKLIISLLILFSFTAGFAQQIPVGSCGIVHIYDASGNRTKRIYFCNNGSDPYPQRAALTSLGNAVSTEFEEVDALYPNPTTGKFVVTFSKALDNASVLIVDESGKIINRVNARGTKVDFDLSKQAAGVYYVRIEQDGKTITKKVIKQ